MPKILIVGNESFDFPLENENGNYGESVTSWAEAVSQALSTVQKPNDIPTTTATILNNISSATPVLGFLFNTSEVLSFQSNYIVKRSTDSAKAVENGRIEGHYDGANWYIAIESVRNAGITFDINSSGQITYVTTSLAGANYTGEIIFSAKVFNQSDA